MGVCDNFVGEFASTRNFFAFIPKNCHSFFGRGSWGAFADVVPLDGSSSGVGTVGGGSVRGESIENEAASCGEGSGDLTGCGEDF